MSHRNKIIEKLSYHQYEPISFHDLKHSQLNHESICYKKEIKTIYIFMLRRIWI